MNIFIGIISISKTLALQTSSEERTFPILKICSVYGGSTSTSGSTPLTPPPGKSKLFVQSLCIPLYFSASNEFDGVLCNSYTTG